MNRAQQSDHFRYLQALNRRHALLRPDESLIESRIQSFELAYRMQFEATDAFDVNQEPEHMLKLYGEGPQNRQLLIARRLVERGDALCSNMAWESSTMGQPFQHQGFPSQGSQ